ncbi:Crp/Fnr family transcriptional regulator [Ciceribacter naphthalenivorans]|uniref:Crp/Fnr family transcriptional regulator n=3 Tax=Pseudomonadota TaxID=1224 RepID=A0A512HQA3_9HYPH|nr:Crp/Fnr family transcriptional regulator [Ciceribacter naphthalenivorans]GLR24907.1 Crp/Fnr family transcriptional regulator [Ciceribacter naphthalenivorans]GLT07763.1 Crp/Fnr family transcriptional regulator [Sphingomonas psychrolutea]
MPNSMGDTKSTARQPLQFHDHAMAVRPEKTLQELNRIGHLRRFESDISIITETDEPSIVGQVISGVVRITQALDDGRQQIVGLALPGEYFGQFFRKGSAFVYEAATDVRACVFPQNAFEALLVRNHELEHMVMMGVLRDLELSREWMMVLGCQNTFERVVSFMLHIHQRMRAAGLPTNNRFIEFPIGRRDIAGYLGTTVETISRHVQALARQRIIRILDNSHFEICNLGRLQSLSKQHWDGATKALSAGGIDPEPPDGPLPESGSRSRSA